MNMRGSPGYPAILRSTRRQRRKKDYGKGLILRNPLPCALEGGEKGRKPVRYTKDNLSLKERDESRHLPTGP